MWLTARPVFCAVLCFAPDNENKYAASLSPRGQNKNRSVFVVSDFPISVIFRHRGGKMGSVALLRIQSDYVWVRSAIGSMHFSCYYNSGG